MKASRDGKGGTGRSAVGGGGARGVGKGKEAISDEDNVEEAGERVCEPWTPY